MKFLFDEHTPIKLVHALRALALDEPYQIHHIREYFSQAGLKDVEWIGTLAVEGGWAFVSEDRRIRRRPADYEALPQARLIGVFLAKGWNQADLWNRASLLIGWWPAIAATVVAASPGQCFQIPFRAKTASAKLNRLPK